VPGTNLKLDPDFEVLQNYGLVIFEDLVKYEKIDGEYRRKNVYRVES